MPPYNPPSTHYCEINGFSHSIDNFKFIGPNGQNFKRLTDKLSIEYLWWNMERNVIEIWGPHSKIKHAKKYLSDYMVRFAKKHISEEDRPVDEIRTVKKARLI